MRLFRNRAKTVLSRRHRDRFRLTLESLEGRQLMAASLLASTLDGVGNPVDVAIQTGGSVVVNMERATNDPSLPYQYTGYQTLPGLTANSIAATTLPDGSPIVVAMTNTQSFLYVNEYAPTGNDAVPRAWTGWQQLSNFVATSVTASTDGDTPGFFAIGANAQVFASFNDSSVTPTDIASSFTDFAPLSNLAVASIAVEPDPDGGYEVAALTGTHTFVYGNTVTPDGTGLTDTGWQQLGNFVATSINVTPGLNTTAFGGDLGDRLFLFAAGTDGNLYYNPLTANFDADTRDSTTYTSIGGGNIVGSKATVADGYLTVYKLTSDGYVVSQELVATGLSANPISPQYQSYLNQDDLYDPTTGSYHESPTFVATELVTTPVRGGGFDILARDSTGANQVDRFGPHDALDFPGYSVIYKSGNGFTDLATRAVHAVATTTAVGGLPIVVSLGSDGSVYYVAEQTAATSSAAATYATLTLIPDLTATSIAVTSLPATAGTGFVVFALTGAQSAIYGKRILRHRRPDQPLQRDRLEHPRLGRGHRDRGGQPHRRHLDRPGHRLRHRRQRRGLGHRGDLRGCRSLGRGLYTPRRSGGLVDLDQGDRLADPRGRDDQHDQLCLRQSLHPRVRRYFAAGGEHRLDLDRHLCPQPGDGDGRRQWQPRRGGHQPVRIPGRQPVHQHRQCPLD